MTRHLHRHLNATTVCRKLWQLWRWPQAPCTTTVHQKLRPKPKPKQVATSKFPIQVIKAAWCEQEAAKEQVTKNTWSAMIDAVELYEKHHQFKNLELQAQLVWNNQVKSVPKSLTIKAKEHLLFWVIDGHMNGPLGICPIDGHKLKMEEDGSVVYSCAVCAYMKTQTTVLHVGGLEIWYAWECFC